MHDTGKTVGPEMKVAAAKRTRILTICVAGAQELGNQLEALLNDAENVDFMRVGLSDGVSNSAEPAISFGAPASKPNVIVLCLPDGGTDQAPAVFHAVRQRHPELSIVVMVQNSNPRELEQYIKMGAADFCLAPFRFDDLVSRLVRWSFLNPKSNALARQLEEHWGLQQFLGESLVFLEVIHRLPKLARCDASVFITGETGTGKEMCARAIHHLGPRSSHPFIPVNCGAIPADLVENELFGHDVGAFTSASTAAKGLIHDAEGGTLFLDEIDSLPLAAQVKLLRFLQDYEYRPLGARKTSRADIRIIAASNADLEESVRSGKFRSDLYFRLNILPLKLPALRERMEDIPLLARHFAAKFSQELDLPVKELSCPALEKLSAHAWPGNIRELENIIKRALVLSENPLITSEDICLPGPVISEASVSFKTLKAQAVANFEAGYVRRLLAANQGNISQAARAAKKNRRAFWQLMRKYEITSAPVVTLR
jgi:DNA-binding NtrC family response regulator